MATRIDKLMNEKLRMVVHRTPSAVRTEKPPTASQAFSAALRQEGRRSIRTEIVKPREASDAPTP